MVITRRKPGTEPGLQVFWIYYHVKNRLEEGGFSIMAGLDRKPVEGL